MRSRAVSQLLLGASASAALVLVIGAGAPAQAAPGVALVAELESFSEGPVFDQQGNLYVSHGRDAVIRIAPDGRRTVWAQVAGPGGHKILPDGTHLLCATGAVLHLDATGKLLAKAAAAWNGQPMRRPNDLTLDGHGGFYFTDPGGSREAPIGAVYHVDAAGLVRLVAGGLWVPNGLVLSPDGRRLYVAETVSNRILWYAVRDDRTLGPFNLFADLPRAATCDGPDGLAVDLKGNVYVAHLGMTAVQVLSPSGRRLRTLATGNFDTSNLAWGGPQMDQLYVTGSIGHRRDTPGRVWRLTVAGARGVR